MPDTSTMVPFSEIGDEDEVALSQKAEAFLASQKWCKTITQRFLAWNLADKIGVFYFRLEPIREGIDNELWVIVGDLPPAYLVCDNAKDCLEALDAYGVEMMKWVKAVREGQSTSEVIPVNAPPTPG